jgi:hypothetical protein
MMSSHSFGKFCIRHDIPCIRHCEILILVSERRLLGEPNVGEEPDGDATEKIDDKPKDRGVKLLMKHMALSLCIPAQWMAASEVGDWEGGCETTFEKYTPAISWSIVVIDVCVSLSALMLGGSRCLWGVLTHIRELAYFD